MPKVGPGGKPEPPPKPPKPKLPEANKDLTAFLDAEAEQESGGNWNAISPAGALGKWQVMPQNLTGWARECNLVPMSPSAFLANHSYQYALVSCILGGYLNRYGPQGAAAMWYSGQSNPGETYGDPPVYVYVQEVMEKYDAILKQGPPPNIVPPGGIAGLGALPQPGNDSWADKISAHAVNFHNGSKNIGTRAVQIRGLLALHEEH
jgi:Transglycosylase SLT domain